MSILPFETSEGAFEYVEKSFMHPKIQNGQTFTGIVRFVDDQKGISQKVYGVEISVLVSRILKKQGRRLVAAVNLNDSTVICDNDLVLVRIEDPASKIPTSLIVSKLTLDLDTDRGEFVAFETTAEIQSFKNTAYDIAKFDLDHKYGNVITNCEFMEDTDNLYLAYTNKKSEVICGQFSKSKKTWITAINRELMDGLNFISTKRFQEIVFGAIKTDIFTFKTHFIEFCHFGLPNGKSKKLSFKWENRIDFPFILSSSEWNVVLLGNQITLEKMCLASFPRVEASKSGLEAHYLKIYFNSDGYKAIPHWCVIYEVLEEDWGDEEVELKQTNIKDLKGYYL